MVMFSARDDYRDLLVELFRRAAGLFAFVQELRKINSRWQRQAARGRSLQSLVVTSAGRNPGGVVPRRMCQDCHIYVVMGAAREKTDLFQARVHLYKCTVGGRADGAAALAEDKAAYYIDSCCHWSTTSKKYSW